MEKSKRTIKIHRNIVFTILFLLPFGLGFLGGMLYRANDIRTIKSIYVEGIESNRKLQMAFCKVYRIELQDFAKNEDIEKLCNL